MSKRWQQEAIDFYEAMPSMGLVEPRAHPVVIARSSDPLTSHQAAASIGPTELRESQKAVQRVIEALVFGTDADIAEVYSQTRERWGLPRQSPSGLRTRRKELVALGLVEDSGKRVALASGRQSIVWRYVR